MSGQHTPGPWEFSGLGDGGRVLALFKKPDGSTYFWEIANAALPIFPTDEGALHIAGGSREANARLIAQAPEMARLIRERLRQVEAGEVQRTALDDNFAAVLDKAGVE